MLAVTVMLLLACALPARADGMIPDIEPTKSLCEQTTSSSQAVDQYASGYLPVNRWGAVTVTHSRLPLSINPATWGPLIQQQTISSALSVGNAGWQSSSALTENAARFCLGDKIGKIADTATATAGKSLISSGLLTGIVVILIASTIWRARRSGGLWQTVGRLVMTLGVLASLVVGASASATSAAGFGKGSPGWWSNQINTVVSSLSAGPVGAINKVVTQNVAADSSNSFDTSKTSNITHCAVYSEVLRTKYEEAFKVWAGGSLNSAVAPTSMDAMWATSGLATFARIQFGNNTYADKVACRLLEIGAAQSIAGLDTPTSTLSALTMSGSETLATGLKIDPNSLAVNPVGNDEIDRSLVGWAACQVSSSGNVSVDPNWAKVQKPLTNTTCEKFFGSPKDKLSSGDIALFDYGDNVDDNVKRTAAVPAVQDFILSMHGNNAGNAMATVFIYDISSIITAIVFGALSIAVIIAKVSLMVLALLAIYMLIAGLFKIHEDGNKAVDLMKHFVVIAFFAFAASLLLSMMALVTSIVQQAGLAMLDPGSTGAAVWVGISPLAGIFMVHLLFSKVLKAPSPFKLNSALAWGAAAGGTGLLAGSALGRAGDRAKGWASNRAKDAAKMGANMVGGKLGLPGMASGGRSKRTAGMTAAHTATATVAGAAAALTADQARTLMEKSQSKPLADRERALLGDYARDFGARGNRDLQTVDADGKAFTPTQMARMDAKMRAQHRVQTIMNTIRHPGSAAGDFLRSKWDSTKGGLSRAVTSVAQNPIRTAAKVAGVGLVAMTIPVGGVAAAAAVGGAWAIKRSAGQRYKRQHGGLTPAKFEKRQAQLDQYRLHLEKRALIEKERQAWEAQEAQAAQDMADEANVPPEDREEAARYEEAARQEEEAVRRPRLSVKKPAKMG